MGRYLSVGLATHLSFNKEKAANVLKSVDNTIAIVQRLYAPENLYEVCVTDQSVTFKLKPEILLEELHDFTTEFYEKCYYNNCSEEYYNQYCKSVTDKLALIKETRKMEEYITEASSECFMFDKYWDNEYIKASYGNYLTIRQYGLTLAYAGKIVMESYGPLFQFFSNSIAAMLSKYRLSKALRVLISG